MAWAKFLTHPGERRETYTEAVNKQDYVSFASIYIYQMSASQLKILCSGICVFTTRNVQHGLMHVLEDHIFGDGNGPARLRCALECVRVTVG